MSPRLPSDGRTVAARGRSRASAKAAGTRFESSIAGYLAATVDDRIERRRLTGAKDRGDLSGLRLSPALGGGRVVAELKDTRAVNLGAWAREVEAERGNDDAVAGFIVHKRHGVSDPGRQWVTMTVDDLVALLVGYRPELLADADFQIG